MQCNRKLLAAFAAAFAMAGGAFAQTTSTVSPQSYDVWMYPPGAGGASPFAPSFASPFGVPEDPDRLGYYFLVFETDGVPAIGEDETVTEITLSVVLLNSSDQQGAVYDPTFDALETYTDGPDPDPGRPIELYAPLLNNEWTLESWDEDDTPVSQNGVYNAQPADFDENGELRNVQSNVDEGFEVDPLAIGKTEDLTGDPEGVQHMEDGALFTFEVDLSDPAVRDYFRERVEEGYVGFVVSSLQDAGVMGGGDEAYPRWSTLESFGPPGMFDASVEITIDDETPPTDCPGDANGDLVVDSTDLNLVLGVFGTESEEGDLDGDGFVDSADLNLVLGEFGTSCE